MGYVYYPKIQSSLIMIDNLTTTELVVIDFMSKGYSNEESAQTLIISLATVKTHISNIYQKYGLLNNRGEKFDGNQRVRLVIAYLKERYGDFEQIQGNYNKLVKQVRNLQCEMRLKGNFKDERI